MNTDTASDRGVAGGQGLDVLVLNLTRFGDLLQSQPLMADLHAAGLRAGLVCLENFAAATPLLRHVDQVWTLPGARFMADLAPAGRGWQAGAGQLLTLTRHIRAEAGHALVLNLTPTLAGRLLARLLTPPDRAILGFGMDAEGFGLNNGMWASFLTVATRQRLNAPLNVADMFRMTAASLTGNASASAATRPRFALREPDANSMAWAREFLTAAGPDNKGDAPAGHVAFQLGASENRRQWPTEHFAALGERLWREARIMPVLLGSAAETPLAAAYARAAGGRHPFADAVGKTDIPRLAALLRQSRLLVTNDTGTMHLAAGLDVPILAFFLATAQAWDTGPYRADCCCLEPALSCHPCAFGQACGRAEACRGHIPAQTVADLALGYLATGDWQRGMTPALAECARVWRTGFDTDGFARVQSLSGHEAEPRSRWLEAQRRFWRQLLDALGRPPDGRPAADAPAAGLAGVAQAEAIAATLNQGARLLDLLAECSGLPGRSARGGQLFLRNCERLQQLLDGCAPLGPLGAFWRELRQSHGVLEELLPMLPVLAAHMRALAGGTGNSAPAAPAATVNASGSGATSGM